MVPCGMCLQDWAGVSLAPVLASGYGVSVRRLVVGSPLPADEVDLVRALLLGEEVVAPVDDVEVACEDREDRALRLERVPHVVRCVASCNASAGRMIVLAPYRREHLAYSAAVAGATFRAAPSPLSWLAS